MYTLKATLKATIILLFVIFSFVSFKAFPQFIENKGQVMDLAENFHPEVKYLYSSGNNAMFFEDHRVVCVFSKKDDFDYSPYDGNQRAKDSIYRTLGKEIQRIDIEFVGADGKSELMSGEKEAAYMNYFLNKRENIRNVGVFKSVCYRNIYPNIDIVFNQYKTGIKYDVILHPGANIEDVKIRYNGANSLNLTDNTVKIKTKLYEFSEDIPIAFINDDNKQVAKVSYNVTNDIISFSCKYSASDKLTIDPVIEWMTFYETATSAGSMDYDHNVADNTGNLFISGYCNNTANDYPVVNPGGSAYVQVYTTNDLYIAKFDPNRALVWGTYFGGSNSAMDWALGTEVMAIGGNILHIVGDGLATNGPFLNGSGFYYNAGSERPYYARFDKTTGQLLHCTNIPGHSSSHPSIAISPSGQVGIMLSTYDWGVIAGHKVTRAGAYNQATNGGFTDLFLMLLNSSYTQIWGTFLGGPGTQENGHIAFDASNNIFFSAEVQWFGSSTAVNEHLVNPAGGAYYQATYNGEDIMIGKFTSTGSLYWNTMYSGNGNDGLDDEMGNGTKVIINPSNELIVIGGTSSTDLPLQTLAGAYNITCPANVNAGGSYDDFASFILKFSNTGVRQWATYWGENSATSWALLYDGKFTSCDKFIVAARAVYAPISYTGYYNKATGGQSFLMQFNNSYAAEWSSYIGNSTSVPQICFSTYGNRLFVTTNTNSQTETTVNPGGGAYYDGVFSGPHYASYSIWQFNIATTPTFSALGPYCVGETPGTLPATSSNGIAGTWSPASISTASSGTVTYTFTPSVLCSSTTTMSVTVNPSPTPTFAALGPYCVGATPGTLSGTSTNGITGNWSPASISTAGAGTTTYTFTPSGGQCATTTTMPVTVNANVTPAFAALGPYCVGAGAGTLQGTSTNGITGNWSPASISTAGAGTTTYTFTPSGGQCATTTTMPVTVNANVTPAFAALGPYCVGAGAGTLQGTSTNGITGNWSPASISTAGAGTTTYTFTPSGGQCATTTTMPVTVNANVTPTFAALGPYCVGASPSGLSGTSTNGIGGTWSPASISTAGAGTTTYTFTPSGGQCATTTTMPVTVNANVTPSFSALGPYCVGAGAGTLQGTSTNGITGNWSPASISTAGAGTTTYTFTPSGGQCATTTTMPVTVNANVTPAFAALGPYCVGAGAGTLQGTSTNGITGNWSPASISTAGAGTTTYTFTPSGGQCATTTTMPVTVNANVTPAFAALGPYCQGATPGTLSGTSTNGITGNWSPATIGTGSAGTTTYTFTPSGGQCATTTTMNVAVTSNVTAVLSGGTSPICDKTSPGTFTVTATGGSGAYVYQWYNAQGVIGGATTSTYTPGIMVASNAFYCSVTSSPCGWIYSDTAIIMVIPQVGNPTPIALSAGTDPLCQLTNGTTTTTYTTTATNNYGFVWSLSNPLAGTIDPATGVMTWANGFYGSVDIQVYALGCGVPSPTIAHTVSVSQTPSAEAGTKGTYTGIPVPLGNISSGPGTFSWSPATGLSDPAIAQPTASPLSTTIYTLTVNNNGCIATDTVTVTFGGLGHIISGKTLYAGRANAGNPVPNTPTYNAVIYTINRTIVVLKNYPANDEVARDTSDATGVYQFTNVMDGNYTLSYDKYTADTMMWCNDVNAIDVALMKYFIGSDTVQDPTRCFSSKYKSAANVDNNGSINAIDVARVKAKIGAPYDAVRNFPKGNWVAFDKQVAVAGSDINVNLETISYGDYNASSSKYRDSANTWSGAKSLTEGFIYTSDESVTIANPTYVEVPLKVNTKVTDFSALGLELTYSNAEYKLVSAYMPGTKTKGAPKINPTLEEIISNDNDLLVTDDHGTIRVVYATTNHFDVAPNDEMIVLGFRALKDLEPGELDFTLSGTGVIGNQFGEENEDTYLMMPKIFVQGNTDAGFEFSGYPNPFQGEATITYNLPEDGTVTLNVYNAIGELVTKLVNENQESGKHSVVFSEKNLAAGLYTFKLEFAGEQFSNVAILKLIK